MALLRLSGKKPGTDEPKQGTSGGGMKTLVILLIILDLCAVGFYGYLKVIKRREVERSRLASEANVLRIREWGDEISQQARRLAQERTANVKEPKNPINKVLMSRAVGDGGTMLDKATVANAVPRAWPQNTNYEAWTVQVQFLQSAGYRFQDLINVVRDIERQNPKVQVSAINFGKRKPADNENDPDWWMATRMEVRVFKPRRRTTQ